MWSRSASCLPIILFCLGLYANYGNTQDISCETPDKISGQCIDIRECEPMLQLLRGLKRPFSTKVSQRLGAFKCDGTSMQVCCPPSSITIPVQDKDGPPDVTNHKNINILPKTCGYLDDSGRIVGGTDAFLNEFPWMALFQYKVGRELKFLCGGTIIHKNYILTAAHCISELARNYLLVSVRVGDHSIKNKTDCEIQDDKVTLKCNPPVQNLKIEEIIPHPEYGGKEGHVVNDIGLVRVSKINLKVENARPVCLPIGIVRDRPFKHVFVTGWGISDIRTGAKSDILQKVGLPVADKEACIKTYQNLGKLLTRTQICAGGNSDKDSCSGDSGGPMMVPTVLSDYNTVYVQQGIVSYGPKLCGISRTPAVYTLVKYYMDWILDTMRP